MILKLKFNFIFKMELSSGRGRPCFVRSFRALGLVACLAALLGLPRCAAAQENYFVTYTHHMEEPGNLEFATKSVTGFPHAGNAFWGNAVEMEYGVKTWWTSEFYLDSQTTANESSVFTGFRFENRFRPLLQEHWINPVLYAEFENINSADKALLEVVGHDGIDDFLGRNDRSEKKREVELKLILSSNFKGWNVAENMIAEKNIAGDPWEFGYAVAVSRPLSLAASPNACTVLPRKFQRWAQSFTADWATATASACTTHRTILRRRWHFICPTGRRSAYRRRRGSTATATASCCALAFL